MNHIVDRLHVTTSNRGVVKAVNRAMRPKARFAREHRQARKQCYRRALERHQRNRETFYYVMRGI